MGGGGAPAGLARCFRLVNALERTRGVPRIWPLRHLGWLAGGAVALALLALAMPRVLRGPEVVVERAERRDFVQSVVASGRVETPHRVSIGSTATASVQRVQVSEGESVAAGAVLVELQSDEARAAMDQAERGAQQAVARLRQLEEVQRPVADGALRQAQANADASERALVRAESLRAQGFVGEAAVDEARRAADVAAAQVSAARGQRAGLATGGADLRLAEATVQQANAAVALARARLAALQLRAPVAAVALERHVEPGDVVQPGRVLIVLSPIGRTELVVQIDEKNLRLVQVGQSALAMADAYPGERFEARVSRLLPSVDAQRGAVEVRLAVPHPPAVLRQDMTVSIDIEVARKPAAVLVPATSVRDADRAQPWVLRLADGRAERRPVRLGLRGDGWMEVLDGLSPGEALVPVSSVAVREGQRVRAIGPPAPSTPASGAATR